MKIPALAERELILRRGRVGGTMSPPTADYPPMNQSYPTPAGTGKPRTRRRGIGPAATMGLVLFGAFVVAGVVGAWAALATYASVSNGLPPATALEKIELPQQSVVWDRSHKVVLARFGEFNRQVVTFDDPRPGVLRCRRGYLAIAAWLGRREWPARSRRAAASFVSMVKTADSGIAMTGPKDVSATGRRSGVSFSRPRCVRLRR